MAANDLARLPIQLDDSSGLSVTELRARCRRWKKEHDIQAILVDPVERLTDARGRRWGSGSDATAEIVEVLRQVTRELDTPVVVFATVPLLKMIRFAEIADSLGPLAGEADTVAYLENEETAGGPGSTTYIASLHVVRQRHGPRGVVPLVFRRDVLRFESRSDFEFEEGEENPDFFGE